MITRISTVFVVAISSVAVGLIATADVEGQVIFLPSFRNFTYRGSVMVPDGGTTSLGGVTSSSEGSSARGVPGLGNVPGLGRGFKNRAIGRDTSAGGLSVTTKVIIQEEIEAQMLADAAARNPGGNQGVNQAILRKAAFITKHIGRNPGFETQTSPSQSSSFRRR